MLRAWFLEGTFHRQPHSRAILDTAPTSSSFPTYSRFNAQHQPLHPEISFLAPSVSDDPRTTTTNKANEAMWVAKEKVGDNSLDAVTVPVPATPPASPPLRNKGRNRRSSLVKAIQMLRSGSTPGGGEGLEQDGRANRSESVATERAGAAVARATPRSASVEGGTGPISYKTLEEGGEQRKQDDEIITELLIGVGPCGSGVAADVDAAEAAAEIARDTTSPRDGRGDDDGEGDHSRDSSSRSQNRRKSGLEKIFSSSTDLTL